jgi:hypothetical protein
MVPSANTLVTQVYGADGIKVSTHVDATGKIPP